MDVTIVDCGIGNIKSVLRMFEGVDATAEIVRDPFEAARCSRLVLPGVGAFDAGMAALNRGWRRALDHVALERKAAGARHLPRHAIALPAKRGGPASPGSAGSRPT